jgi:hypothetical protein
MSWQGSASHHKKRLAAGRLQTSFLRLTFATFKSLFLLSLKTVAKLTLFAQRAAKKRRRFGGLYRFVYYLAVGKRWQPCQCQCVVLHSMIFPRAFFVADIDHN